jgi:hypothetical protein
MTTIHELLVVGDPLVAWKQEGPETILSKFVLDFNKMTYTGYYRISGKDFVWGTLNVDEVLLSIDDCPITNITFGSSSIPGKTVITPPVNYEQYEVVRIMNYLLKSRQDRS